MMALSCDYVKHQLVIPVFTALGMIADNSVELGLGTIACEADFGAYRKQIGGDAWGICQIEQATYADLWRYLLERPKFYERVISLVPCETPPDIEFLGTGVGDVLSVALMRIKYWMIPAPIPPAGMIGALGSYYKQYYNTPAGKGSALNFVKKYQEYVTC